MIMQDPHYRPGMPEPPVDTNGHKIIVFDEGWFHADQLDDHLKAMLDRPQSPVAGSKRRGIRLHLETLKNAPRAIVQGVRRLWAHITSGIGVV